MLSVGSDELLVLTIESEWKHHVSLTVSELPNLDSWLRMNVGGVD